MKECWWVVLTGLWLWLGLSVRTSRQDQLVISLSTLITYTANLPAQCPPTPPITPPGLISSYLLFHSNYFSEKYLLMTSSQSVLWWAGLGWTWLDHYNHIASPLLSLTNNWHTGFLPSTEHGRGLQSTGNWSLVNHKQTEPTNYIQFVLSQTPRCRDACWCDIGMAWHLEWLDWVTVVGDCRDWSSWHGEVLTEVPLSDTTLAVLYQRFLQRVRQTGWEKGESRVSDWLCPHSHLSSAVRK